MLADQQRLTFISSMQTLDAIWSIYQEQWPVGTDGEKESRESVLLASYDDYIL